MSSAFKIDDGECGVRRLMQTNFVALSSLVCYIIMRIKTKLGSLRIISGINQLEWGEHHENFSWL